MMQRRELASKPLPDGKTQEEKGNEEMSPFNILNQGDIGLAAGRFPPSPPPLLHTPEIGPRRAPAPILSDERIISP